MVVTKMWRSSLAWTSVCCVAVIVWRAERATAAILVDDLYTYATQDEYKHQVADFGHHLPKAGYFGILTAADPIDACEEIQHAPRNKSGFGWIVIVKRGGCNFDEKALQAQEQGFVGVIVYDPNSNRVEEMKGDDVADQVEILATFVGRDSGEQMLDLYCNGTFLAAIFKDPVDITYYLIPFAIIIGVCLVILLTFLIIKCSRDCMKKRQSRISREHLKKMPLHRYKKGDTYDVCAICLDDFEEGEKLRVLPCNHAYHQKCVDPWLLRKRRTCPVCKRKAIPGSDSNSYNSSDSDSVNSITYSDSSASESSPLLAHGNRATHPNNNALLDSDSSSEELQGVVVVCPSNNRTVDVAQIHTSSGSSNVAPVAGTSISVGREVVGSYGAMDFRVSHPPPAATRRPDPSGMQEYASSISSAESGEVFRVVQPSALSRSPAANSHHSINNSPPAAVNDDARSASHSPHNSSHSTSPNASNNDGNGSKLNFITKLLNRLSSDSDDGDDQDDDHTFLV